METDFDYVMDDYDAVVDDYYEESDEMANWNGAGDPALLGVEAAGFWQTLDDCVIPSTREAAVRLTELLSLCFVLRIAICSKCFSGSTLHVLSVGLGLIALYRFFSSAMIYVIIFCVVSYIVLFCVCLTVDKLYGPALSLFMLIFFLVCELFLADPYKWHSVRGSLMIVGLKILSLGFDIDREMIESIPSSLEYLSYSLCVGSVIFGPWHSFRDYKLIFLTTETDVKWFVKMFKSATLAFICLIISVCGSGYLLDFYKTRWIAAYKDALSFRMSHYFVSFMSEVTAVAVGLGRVGSVWKVDVSRPEFIEVPRSLVEVVMSWNLPMHYWLKTYVFRQLTRYPYFVRILGTYAASSLLHGFNFQLAAVLLSLGVYTYIEHNIRRTFADTWDACIEARGCVRCHHRYGKYHPSVFLTNLAFGALAMLHLAYLGVMFNSDPDIEGKGYDMWHTVQKWRELGFASHFIALGTFVIHYLVG